MLATTEAIVLALQRHSDKARILHAYTRAYGRINYMVYGLGHKHGAGSYTPFSLIQLTADYPPPGSSRPATVKETATLTAMPAAQDPYRTSVALFLSEVLFHTLRYPTADEPLFNYIAQAATAIQSARQTERANFHLQFLIGFAGLLGFGMDEYTNKELLTIPATRSERQKQLRKLCAYFAEHVDTWEDPRSLDILMEVFD